MLAGWFFFIPMMRLTSPKSDGKPSQANKYTMLHRTSLTLHYAHDPVT